MTQHMKTSNDRNLTEVELEPLKETEELWEMRRSVMAEYGIIAALIFRPEMLPKIADLHHHEKLSARDFRNPLDAVVFETAMALFEAGATVDLPTICEAVRRRTELNFQRNGETFVGLIDKIGLESAVRMLHAPYEREA